MKSIVIRLTCSLREWVGVVHAESQVSMHEVDQVGNLPHVHQDRHVALELTLVVPQKPEWREE